VRLVAVAELEQPEPVDDLEVGWEAVVMLEEALGMKRYWISKVFTAGSFNAKRPAAFFLDS
jgi:hypothetical protein